MPVALAAFANRRSFSHAAEVLGLERRLAPGFADLRPQAAMFPWEAGDPDTSGATYRATIARELGAYSSESLEKLNEDQSIRGQAVVNRILSIGESIQKLGYDPTQAGFHPIEGQLLVAKDDEWVVLIRQGEHRVAALAASGSELFPIIVDRLRMVRELEHRYWPQVSNGRIIREGALDVFARIMRGGEDAPNVNVVGWP